MYSSNGMYLENTAEIKSIKEGYKQTFQNKFTSSISKNEVIKMKHEGTITDRDVAIAKFLFKFRFATLEQIYTFLKIEGILTQQKPNSEDEMKETSPNSIKSRLDKLVQNRILNKFMLSKIEEDRIQQDALIVYCLDLGGKFLLTNFSNEDTTDWYVTVNLKASEIIGKDLFATQFYLRLKESCGDRMVYFETYPVRKCDKTNIVPSFEFALKHNGEIKYFLGEVTREMEIYTHFRKKIDKLEKLVDTNAWKKYYFDTQKPPVLFLFTENDLLAGDVGRIVNGTSIDKFRISTDDRILGDLSTAFMTYVPEVNKLKLVKLSVLS